MYFREKVVQLRKDSQMTQDYFARAVGVSRQAVYKWEKGKSYPEAEKLILIAKLFGVTVDSLLEDDYALFELALPALQKKAPAKKKAAKKPAAKKPVAEKAAVKEEPVAEAPAAPAPVAENAAAPAPQKTVTKEPMPLRATPRKPQPQKKQQKPAGLFDGIRGLFGRKK